MKAVKADEGLQEKLKSADDADAVVAIAKATGFVCSIDDLVTAKAELSDEQLEGVSGGLGPLPMRSSLVFQGNNCI